MDTGVDEVFLAPAEIRSSCVRREIEIKAADRTLALKLEDSVGIVTVNPEPLSLRQMGVRKQQGVF